MCEHQNVTVRHHPPGNKVLGQRVGVCDDCGAWRTVSPTGVNGEWRSGMFTIVQHGDKLDSEGRLEFTIQCDACGERGVPMFKDGGLDKAAMDAFKERHWSGAA